MKLWSQLTLTRRVIGKAIAVVAVLQQFVGFGPPYDGSDLKDASGHFTAVCDQLRSAFPDEGWQGMAQRAYSGRNAGQLGCAQSMASLDSELAGIVNDQADTVNHVRWGFGALMTLLAVAYIYELRMAYSELAGGPAAAQYYATAGARVGMGVAGAMVVYVFGRSAYNGGRAGDVADGYRALTP